MFPGDGDSSDVVYKVILVGDTQAGKTHLRRRFIEGSPPKALSPTIGAEYATRMLTLAEGIVAKVQFWDLAGQEKYRAITSGHFRRALGCLIVYDVTHRATYDNCQKWLDDVKKQVGPNIAYMLVGNKMDLVNDDPSARQVSQDEAAMFAECNGLLFAEVSAVTNTGVKEVFESLVQEVYYHRERIVLTLEKVVDHVVEHVGDEAIQLQVTNVAGEVVCSFEFDCKVDSFDGVLASLSERVGRPTTSIYLMQIDGSLLADAAALAAFLGMEPKEEDNQKKETEEDKLCDH
eukprot:TRINITY_DN52196_c0_g1_i1.p1 TRINITY_DN52196_c0_g1~~TRINITY_DN52196_c0_g1_i1.p1  ORF type:complete len:290 (+),score=51.86 TRINITY_DN52196_c0_g1_i1:71-940(+)